MQRFIVVGGFLLKRLRLALIIGTLIVLFQNCSQDESPRSRAFVIDRNSNPPPVVADQEISDSAADFGNGVQGVGQMDPQTCFLNYITVFEWLNPADNVMSVKPILNTQKIKTIELGKNSFINAPISAGWSIEGIVQSNSNGSTKMSIKFNKGNPGAFEFLDCYLMRVDNQETLDSGLANTLFQNMGYDQNASILVGFLRYQEQFVACQVRSSQADVDFSGAESSALILHSDKAFVIKRGCYQ